MLLWRLATAAYAERFDGGYGLVNAGRWNVAGQRVTYAATHPSLCLLERLVHVADLALLPHELVMVLYEAPDSIPRGTIALDALPRGWQRDEWLTQRLGAEWLDQAEEALLFVPSVVVAMPEADDRNIVINHRHADTARIRIRALRPFEIDTRLL
jgi:RES domain-containing protein